MVRPHRPSPREPITRRDFLRRGVRTTAVIAAGSALGIGTAGAGYYFDRRLEEHTWSVNNTALTVLDASHRPVDEAWVVMPGFGDRAGKTTANRLTSALSTKPPVAYITYSNQGIDLAGIALLLQGYSRYLATVSYRSSLSVFGESMGGAVALAGAGSVEVPINRVVLSSSPFDLSTARLGELGRLVADSGYSGGVIGGYFYNVANDVNQDGIWALPVDLVKAAGEVSNSPPPRLWASQVSVMQAAGEVLDGVGVGFPHAVGPDTEVLYCGPRRPSTDHTVDEDAAAARYRRFFSARGATFTRIGLPYAGHSHTKATLADTEVRAWLRRTAPRPPVPPVTAV